MLRIYSRISVWSMTGMTSVCIGVDFRKASSFFTYADSSRSCVVRSKSQKLESTISDWNQYWMQIESRFFAPFTTIPSPPLLSHPFSYPVSPFGVRTRCACTHIHSVSPFSTSSWYTSFPSLSFALDQRERGARVWRVSIKKKWLTALIDNERHFSVSSCSFVKILPRFYDLVTYDGIQCLVIRWPGYIGVSFARGWRERGDYLILKLYFYIGKEERWNND